jgi:hypothetical protein
VSTNIPWICFRKLLTHDHKCWKYLALANLQRDRRKKEKVLNFQASDLEISSIRPIDLRSDQHEAQGKEQCKATILSDRVLDPRVSPSQWWREVR